MRTRRLIALVAAGLAVSAVATESARAQDFYDTTVLRTVYINFHDTNWLQLLRQNYAAEIPILADLVVDGITYPNVGVRIRGNTSYTALPSGSEKFSLKVYMDYVDPEQELMGYDSLNFNNAFRDPTFCREVVYNNYVAQFIPNPRANHVVLVLNGQNWGVYCNIQQPDKRMLRDYFVSADGLRIRCPNNPNGPGLRYLGSNPALYTGSYEIQHDGGLADPWGALIAVCDSVTNEPLSTWPNIDRLFAIDPSIWSVVLENFLTDDDSYVNKGSDFMTYRDPLDGRTHLLQRDANETFTQATWSITRNFTATNKPVLSHVLAVPELRQRYMAHYRTVKPDLTWDYFGPIFMAHRDLIAAAVQADPKKLYSYELFQQNFTSTVYMPYPGLAGGNIIGLKQFVDQRAAFLAGIAELTASGPTINWVQASNAAPEPGEPVQISASVVPAGAPAGAFVGLTRGLGLRAADAFAGELDVGGVLRSRQSGVILRVDTIDRTGSIGATGNVGGGRLGFLQRLFQGGVGFRVGFGADLGEIGLVGHAGLDELVFEQRDAVRLVMHAHRAAGGRVPVEPGDHGFEHVGTAFLAAVFHGAADGVPTGDGIVTVDHLAGNAERLAAVDDVAFAVLGPRLGGNPPAVVGDDHEDREFVFRPRAPDHARGEVPFGGAGVPSHDDRDAVAAVTLLYPGGPGGHGILDLDDAGDRHYVPFALGEMAHEVPPHAVAIGDPHGHLADAVDQRHAHRHHGRAVAVVQVEVVVVGTLAALDLQAQAGIEGFFPRAADPEIPLAGLGHLDHHLLHGPRAAHVAVDL